MAVLREVLHLPQLTPLVNNVAAAMIMVVFFRCAIEASGWLRVRTRFTILAAHCRQMLQMNFCTSIVFWPLFDTTDDWSWRLNGVLPAAMALRMIYKVRRWCVYGNGNWKYRCGLMEFCLLFIYASFGRTIFCLSVTCSYYFVKQLLLNFGP